MSKLLACLCILPLLFSCGSDDSENIENDRLSSQDIHGEPAHIHYRRYTSNVNSPRVMSAQNINGGFINMRLEIRDSGDYEVYGDEVLRGRWSVQQRTIVLNGFAYGESVTNSRNTNNCQQVNYPHNPYPHNQYPPGQYPPGYQPNGVYPPTGQYPNNNGYPVNNNCYGQTSSTSLFCLNVIVNAGRYNGQTMRFCP